LYVQYSYEFCLIGPFIYTDSNTIAKILHSDFKQVFFKYETGAKIVLQLQSVLLNIFE